MRNGNLPFYRLPGTALPTVFGNDVVICETSDGRLWKVDSGGSSEIFSGDTTSGDFNVVGKLAAPIINGIYNATLSSTTFTATVGNGITSISAGDKITIRINSNIVADTAYTFRVYNGTSYLASASIYWNTGSSYSTTNHDKYYGSSTYGMVFTLVFSGSYWFIDGLFDSRAHVLYDGSAVLSVNLGSTVTDYRYLLITLYSDGRGQGTHVMNVSDARLTAVTYDEKAGVSYRTIGSIFTLSGTTLAFIQGFFSNVNINVSDTSVYITKVLGVK